MDRNLGVFTGSDPGPLLIVTSALHGNEPAGVLATQEVFRMLASEPDTNPSFVFKGRMVGLIGHCTALAAHQRYFDRDLNRQWTPENIAAAQLNMSDPEATELLGLFEAIQAAINDYPTDQVIFLDLHTTSAPGGIFTIPTAHSTSLSIARSIKAPVILGLLDGVKSTLLTFAAAGGFIKNGSPGVAFEAGQHDDPLSVSRAISGIISCLRGIGCVDADDVDSRHDAILQEFSRDLPQVTRLKHIHRVKEDDQFKMRPGYVNFQPITAHEILADDRHGGVLSPMDGLILMPLYQPRGADGFFIVEAVV